MSGLANEKKDLSERAPQNIQEGFLNNARRERILVTLYLLSGVKLSGRIRSFDKFSLILENNHQEQLIFKHAISTVIANRVPAAHPAAPPAEEDQNSQG
ncbi:MAG: RNA chaperone Hfq [Terriglobia bacterium]